MKNNSEFYQVPKGIMELGLTSNELGVYMALKHWESKWATDYDCFFMANEKLMELTGIKNLHTLCKYKNGLKRKGAIIELPRVHVRFNPAQQSEKGFCTYFLPDTSLSAEKQKETYEKALKRYKEEGIVSSSFKKQGNSLKYDILVARCQNSTYGNMLNYDTYN